MKKLVPIVLILFIASGEAFAQSRAGVLIDLKEVIQSWIAVIASIALAISGGVIVLGNLMKISMFRYLADEWQKGFLVTGAIAALSILFQSELATLITRLNNLFGA